MKNKNILQILILIIFTAITFSACQPLKEFGRTANYIGDNNFKYSLPSYDSLKKTVLIVANNDGTELFDMMAPYYLFNTTEKANVYVVAKNKFPIVVKKGFFVLPQSTFGEIDSLGISPDVIVIPFLSAADSLHQDPIVVSWIKKHYSDKVNILSICDGAATAAATGIFDSKPITAHASDFQGIKNYFSKPLWMQNVSVAHDGNLYSTAGVSNAAEGSLLVIKKIFGSEIMSMVIQNIHYPGEAPKIKHQSNRFQFNDKLAVGKKIILRKNNNVGVLLQNGINEFELAAVMDTYNRTFPASIQSFSYNDSAIKSKYGLTIIPTGKITNNKLNELHLIHPVSFSKSEQVLFDKAKVVQYDRSEACYIIDQCLDRIGDQYGVRFKNSVKLMLDYN